VQGSEGKRRGVGSVSRRGRRRRERGPCAVVSSAEWPLTVGCGRRRCCATEEGGGARATRHCVAYRWDRAAMGPCGQRRGVGERERESEAVW
jgi:hypothetical protein